MIHKDVNAWDACNADAALVEEVLAVLYTFLAWVYAASTGEAAEFDAVWAFYAAVLAAYALAAVGLVSSKVNAVKDNYATVAAESNKV